MRKPREECRVGGCHHLAEYAVVWRTWYSPRDGIAHEDLDATFPFLCFGHVRENIRDGGRSHYPAPNLRRLAEGDVYELGRFEVSYDSLEQDLGRWQPPPPSLLVELNDELWHALKRRPRLLDQVSPRLFEQLVASIFANRGFAVDLTRASHDGGVDIYATKHDVFGPLLYVIECKRYSPYRKVGIDIVQRLYGVAQEKRASKGLVVTTSSFTQPAVAYAAKLYYTLSLHDYSNVVAWLSRHETA